MNKKININTQLSTAKYNLASNNPVKTYSSCKQALETSNTLLTDEQRKPWIELLEQAETAILNRRKTNSGYASQIKLSIAETSIDQRTITSDSQSVTSESSTSTIKIAASEEVSNNTLWTMCISYLKCDALDKIENLCTKQLQLLLNDQALNNDQTLSSQNLLLKKHLESIQGWLELIHQNSYNKAKNFAQNELTDIKEKNTSNRSFAVSGNPSQQDLWETINNYTDGIIRASNSIMDNLLNPKPQISINWDRFSQSPFLNHFRFINQDIYADLYAIALQGRDQVNYEIKLRTMSGTCLTLLLTLATPILLYVNDYTSILESKLIAIPMFLCGLLFTISYILITATLTEENILEKIRAQHRLAAKQK